MINRFYPVHGSMLMAAPLLAALLIGVAPRPCLAGGQDTFLAFDGQARELVEKMTLEEKVGQMVQADIGHLKNPTDIEDYFMGSLLSGGSSDPKAGNSLEAWTEMYERYQQRALKTRLGIPILYGVDAVHGHGNVLGAVIFPHHVGLGCTRNAALAEEIGRITAMEVRATGINWTFAPCVTVPRDERWGRSYEGFSENPELVELLGAAMVRGLQGESLKEPLSILACAKHFVGDGGTSAKMIDGKVRLDQGDTQLDEAALRKIHLRPYIDCIAAGVGTIMPSYSSWNGVKCSGSAELLTGILKKELGFEGFLISDYNAIDQVDKDYKIAIAQCINAGMDMAMVPDKYALFYTNLMALVQEGEVPMARIDDAVTRILRVKFAMGLMDADRAVTADRALWKSFGSKEHREVARQAVRESLVLLKNEGHTLPLAKDVARIHVSGRIADDIGNQCGGWTIDWQGKSGAVTEGGTTILESIKHTVPASTKVTFSLDGTGAEGASVGVLVIGETPYAEFEGDRDDLSLAEKDVAAFDAMKSAGIPVVAVLVSGRPMLLGDVLDRADAIMAVWLPGTEGEGVADVLFGDYAPTGKLAFTWPRSMKQVPINIGDGQEDPLFPYGYGLSY